MENVKIKIKKKSVTVSVEKDGDLLEITGDLVPYNTGRDKEYNFETDWFSSDEAEAFYDANYSEIEDLIMEKFNA